MKSDIKVETEKLHKLLEDQALEIAVLQKNDDHTVKFKKLALEILDISNLIQA